MCDMTCATGIEIRIVFNDADMYYMLYYRIIKICFLILYRTFLISASENPGNNAVARFQAILKADRQPLHIICSLDRQLIYLLYRRGQTRPTTAVKSRIEDATANSAHAPVAAVVDHRVSHYSCTVVQQL